jgi:hypothetical protein
MALEIFESLFWISPGFVPKSHLVESFSNDRHKEEEEDVEEIENRSIKSDIILVVMRYLLGLRNKGKNRNMQIVTPLYNCCDNYVSKNIVVSLDDKYVGVILEETNDKILVTSDESEDHNRFEIPKCKIIMTASSINKRMILDLEYTEILKYKMDYCD